VRLVIIDVIGLYTSIPHQDLLTAHGTPVPSQTNISLSERVVDIANHVLSSNVFSFEDDYFQLIFGTPSAANLFMGWLEVQLLASSPVPVSQDTWKRFIDDIFFLWTGTPEDLDVFFQHINSFYPSIKFTIASSTEQLPFLDILISLKDGFLQTSVPDPQIPTPTTTPNHPHPPPPQQLLSPLPCCPEHPLQPVLEATTALRGYRSVQRRL